MSVTTLPRAVDLRADRRVDPIGIDERPRLSWRVQLEAPATRQSSFAIEVAADPTFTPGSIMWSPTEVAGAETAIAYDGPPVHSRSRSGRGLP